jgi:hypothetical protein
VHDPAYIDLLRRLTPSERLLIGFAMRQAVWEVLREFPPEVVQSWLDRQREEPWNPPNMEMPADPRSVE